MKASQHDVRVYSSRTCGWAKRLYAALLEKGVEFALISAKDHAGAKTPEFRHLTPVGRTPVFVHGDLVLWESLIINEYIASEFPGPDLRPKHPAEQAEARDWLHYCDNDLSPILNRLIFASDREAKDIAHKELDAALGHLEKRLSADNVNKPYWSGDRIGLVDIGFALLFDSMRHVDQEDVTRLLESRPRILRWREAIEDSQSIRHANTILDEFSKDPISRIISPEDFKRAAV